MNNLQNLATTYHRHYHDVKHHGSLAAARVVLPLLLKRMDIRSVLDVGCASGSWLAAARDLGIDRLVGVEGEWAREWTTLEHLPLSQFELLIRDLEQPLNAGSGFDLAICLELAEHLPAHRSAGLVADLCASADCVLFSAAIPGQMGHGHVNEQWQSHWARLFRDHGYEALDIIRPAIWENDAIPYWYRQNTILYRRGADLGTDGQDQPPGSMERLDIVHPRLLEKYAENLGKPWTLSRIAGQPLAFLGLIGRRLMNR
jgi:SAM-dependent methyltransferase